MNKIVELQYVKMKYNEVLYRLQCKEIELHEFQGNYKKKEETYIEIISMLQNVIQSLFKQSHCKI